MAWHPGLSNALNYLALRFVTYLTFKSAHHNSFKVNVLSTVESFLVMNFSFFISQMQLGQKYMTELTLRVHFIDVVHVSTINNKESLFWKTLVSWLKSLRRQATAIIFFHSKWGPQHLSYKDLSIFLCLLKACLQMKLLFIKRCT